MFYAFFMLFNALRESVKIIAFRIFELITNYFRPMRIAYDSAIKKCILRTQRSEYTAYMVGIFDGIIELLDVSPIFEVCNN